ncbi:hypothetical protein HPB48_016764 [Haemaphysalis longicornis]|uniref:Carboxylesterase type B domain-containing protein n=1 Tax=Haemaphysalis longicornis TaxID=44386 RepID=A0A9J6FTR2_HAELO|nr:hypothetical protein HPB48_016764 [Haemaphysalis longicornis]
MPRNATLATRDRSHACDGLRDQLRRRAVADQGGPVRRPLPVRPGRLGGGGAQLPRRGAGLLSGGPSGSEPLPGNAGLHDQRLAFAWTLHYIPHFGGNASRIVLAGHDAGASSIGYHLLSGDADFWTRHVTRFILQSGGPYHRYGGNNLTEQTELAKRLHCSTDLSSNKALACLQNAAARSVARALPDATFVPVFHRTPLTGPQPSPDALRGRSAQVTGLSNKQFLVGRVEREGVYRWFVERHRGGLSNGPDELASRLLHPYDASWHKNWQTATGIVLNPVCSDLRPYQEAVGDFTEVCPMIEFIESLQAWRSQVYAYQLAYQPSYSDWRREADEAVHFEDMELVFGLPLGSNVHASEADKEWARVMISVWATFAHTGKAPTLRNTPWPKYDTIEPFSMKLGPQHVTMKKAEKLHRCVYLRTNRVTP